MKRKYIKYDKLSSKIRKEIDKFHKSELKEGGEITIEDSMVKWFDNNFDEWLNENYVKTDSDNRKHFRLDVEIPINIVEVLIESSQDDKEAKDFVGKCFNISRGGIYFKYNKEIEISSIIKVMINLSNVDKELNNVEALAMIVRVEKLENGEFGIGVMFSSIYETGQEHLDVFILKSITSYIYTQK